MNNLDAGYQAFSAGTTKAFPPEMVFSNSNGIGFGINGSTLTASHNGLSAAIQAVAAHAGGSITSGTLIFSNTDGHMGWVRVGQTIYGAHDGITEIRAGTRSALGGAGVAVNFSEGNGITFGLNGANGSVMTASYTVPTVTNSSWTLSDNATSFTVARLAFSQSNGLTLSLSTAAGGSATVVGSYTVPTVTNSSWTVSNGATSGTVARLAFTNLNGVTLSLSTGAGGSHTIVGSHNGITSQMTQFLALTLGGNTAGTTTFHATNNASLFLHGGANITLSGNGSTVTIVGATAPAAPVGVSAGTTSGNLSTIVFSDSNGISFGLNGSTITARVGYLSSYENIPVFAPNASTTTQTFNGASISVGVAFQMPLPISASFLRFVGLMTTNSTTIATMASATASAQGSIVSTLNAVIYSLGTGASSKSLISVASGSAGFTFQNSISITNSTQYSITQGFSAQAEGNGTTRTTQYSISNTNYSFTTNQIGTEFSSVRFLDVPFANSLSAGAYWLVVGLSTNSGSAGAAGLAALTNCNVRYGAHYVISQFNLSVGVMGSTNLTSGGLFGAGSFSTAGGGTTSAFPISAISSSASHQRLPFQLLRSA